MTDDTKLTPHTLRQPRNYSLRRREILVFLGHHGAIEFALILPIRNPTSRPCG